MTAVPDDLLQRLRHYGQEHVLAFWDRLNDAQRRRFASELLALDLDLDELRRLYAQREQQSVVPAADRIAPLPRPDDDPARHRPRGEQALRDGAVAFLIVAGGQGTRLGFDRAKGLFPVGPLSRKTLFQVHAEKVLALRRRFGQPLPLLLMTSPATDAETRDFFAAQHYFGLPAEDVWFFCQGTMPALDLATGKLLLEAPDRLFLSPNGHGGCLTGLADSGLLDRLAQRDVHTIYYFQVDNPLINLADYAFLGRHLAAEAEVSSKVVPKDSPTEKVGNFVLVDGRCAMIEYSDLDAELAHATDEQGRPRLWAGNPAIHLFDVAFLRLVTAQADGLPWHLARKAVACLDESGQTIKPETPNALKFERFIFDVLPEAERWTVMETSRAAEFAPLKNKDGPDSPATVYQALVEQAAVWLEQAGVDVPRDGQGRPRYPLEISPLFALDAEELASKVDRSLRIVGPTYLDAEA